MSCFVSKELCSTLIILLFSKTPRRTYQRWIDVETKLIVNMHQRCFNVGIWLKMKVEPMYIYRRCFIVDKTTLKQSWKNCVDSMLMTQCCLNVDIWLKRKVESTYIHRRRENRIESGSITKQNQVFKYKSKIFIYIKT